MPDVMVNNGEWDQLDADAQNAIMSAVSQSFGYNVVPAGGGAMLSTEQSAASAEATAGDPTHCAELRDACIQACDAAGSWRSWCVSACIVAYAACLLL